ncbi:hypothetical protein B0H10DRAFT_658754 [Mycena sp. CBHHK59/15]|nr:hypothetical protein B0H10DRAFT_658754 [Mycena sp. CBHHK59/15]
MGLLGWSPISMIRRQILHANLPYITRWIRISSWISTQMRNCKGPGVGPSRFHIGAYNSAIIPEGLTFIPLVSYASESRSRYWSVRLSGIGVGENIVEFTPENSQGTLTDSGSVFSYFDEDVLSTFYNFIPGAIRTDDGVWTFPYPPNARKSSRIFISFNCGLGHDDRRVVHHELSLRQFVYEKGKINPGDRVHGIFQAPGAQDSTVAPFPKDVSMQVIGQSFLCHRPVYYSRTMRAIAFGARH